MKRVLFISSRPIYPIVSGIQIRTAQQLEFLTQRYEVDVIYQSGGSGVEDAISGHLPHVGKVIRFVQPAWKRYLRTLRFLFNDLPLQVNYYYQKEIQAYIDAHLNEYDIIFCNNIRTAEYVIRVKNVIKYMDFVDAISMNYEKARKQAKGFRKWIYTIDYKRCLRYEQRILNAFDRCATISEIDKQYILECQRKFVL